LGIPPFFADELYYNKET